MLASRVFAVLRRPASKALLSSSASKQGNSVHRGAQKARSLAKTSLALPQPILSRQSVRWSTEAAKTIELQRLYDDARRHLKEQNTVACLEACTKILNQEPDNAVINLYIAGCYYMIKQYDKCLTHIDKVILQRPRDLAAYHTKGKALLALNKLDAALVSFNKALKLNDRHLESVFMRAHILELMGNFDEAAYGFRKAAFIKRSHINCVRAADCFLKLKNYTEALEYYDLGIEFYKFHPPLYLGKARALQENGKLRQALDTLDEMLHVLPGNLDGYLGQAIILQKLDKPQQALEAILEVLEVESDNVSALTLQASLLSTLGQYVEAIDVYNKLLLKNPNDLASVRGKLNACKQIGDTDNTAELETKAVELEKKKITSYLDMGSLAWKNELYGEALEHFENLARLQEDHPTAALGRGVALTHLGRPKEAKSALQYAIALDPEAPIAHFYLGQIHQHNEDYANALKSFKKAHKYQPSNTEALVKVGQIHILQKNYDDAVEAFDGVLEADPSHKVASAAKLAALKAANSM